MYQQNVGCFISRGERAVEGQAYVQDLHGQRGCHGFPPVWSPGNLLPVLQQHPRLSYLSEKNQEENEDFCFIMTVTCDI